MDGYSVDEAAAVLGVPQARVWELLARGILGGAERSGDMRVFLKTDAPPAAREAPSTGSGGNGGNGHGFEMSAFRELLTEFRNLTERYGQALLALGEARGEVAALRGRVELLEARIDRGLTPALAPAPIYQTDAPMADTEEAVQPPMDAAPTKRNARPKTRPKARPKRPRPNLDEALARADDPTSGMLPGDDASELPGAREAAAALAELRGDRAEAAPSAATPAEPPAELPRSAWEPRESPPAALVEGPYTAVVEEPDWIAEDDLLVLGEPEVAAVPVEALPEPEPSAEIPARPTEKVAPGPTVQAESAADPGPRIVPDPDPLPLAADGEDEFETASATYQTAVPPLPPLFGEATAPEDLVNADPLTQVAASQGWAADEVEAMRRLLAADAGAEAATESSEPAIESAPPPAEPELQAANGAEADEPEDDAGPDVPESWPAADALASRPTAPAILPAPARPAPAPRPSARPARPRRNAGQRAARRLRRLFGG